MVWQLTFALGALFGWYLRIIASAFTKVSKKRQEEYLSEDSGGEGK